MPRSRIQQRMSSCSSIFLASVLAVIAVALFILNARAPKTFTPPTPSPTPTFVGRDALALAPAPELPFTLPDLPTFTPTPTITPTPTPTHTPTPTPLPVYKAQVTALLANLRKGPGDSYDIITMLPMDEEVVLKGRNSDAQWFFVHTDAGDTGWLFADLLQVEPGAKLPVLTPPPTATPGPPQIKVELANLRTGPGSNYALITMLPQGTIFVPEARNATGDWMYGTTPDGQEGWLFIDLLSQIDYLNSLPQRTPPPAPTPASTPTPNATVDVSASSMRASASSAQPPPLVLANYFAWYEPASWDACNISAGDQPLRRYHSDDPAAIAQHVQMAQSAGLDGFTLQWVGPGDRTDRNFATLLQQSAGRNFHSTVIFLRHIWPGATPANTTQALQYLMDTYAGQPNFLRINGRPVIFFTDVYRIPTTGGQSAQQAWASLRAQIDPNHQSLWIAEGLDPSFLTTFDGLWVYKIFHAAYPNDYLKASAWAARTRAYGANKLWVATISPGWDDRNAGCRPDIRVPSQPFVKPRQQGAVYQATFDAALKSQPDLLWLNSFNEWVEGTYIEPSQHYGDFYLQRTKVLVAQFKQKR